MHKVKLLLVLLICLGLVIIGNIKFDYINLTNRTYERNGDKYEVEIEDITDLFDHNLDCGTQLEECINTSEYKFFLKLYDIYQIYRSRGVSIDMSVLTSTLMYPGTDYQEIFEKNLNTDYTHESLYDSEGNIIKGLVSPLDWEYDYKKVPGYVYLNALDDRYDAQILAKNMVTKTIRVSCPNESVKTYYDIETSNYSEYGIDVCEDGSSASISASYQYDAQKYDNFLIEFMDKKYYKTGSDEIGENNTFLSGYSNFSKYAASDENVLQIARLAYREQGSVEGAAAEASLLANLFELRGSSYGTGVEGLINYAKNSGWFGDDAASTMASGSVPDEVVAAVRKVIVEGKRTLPSYVDEHDCWYCNDRDFCSDGKKGDICSVKNDGKSEKIDDRSVYKQDVTKIHNVYGSTYTFYTFPTSTSDPFGYTSKSIKDSKGDCYYDITTGTPVNCQTAYATNDYARALLEKANAELSAYSGTGGAKYNKYMGSGTSAAWCANFVSYVISETEINGTKLYPNVIPFRSSLVADFMKGFINSSNSNIKFYYNSSCNSFKNIGGQSFYTPKPGDLIFFDWKANYKSVSDIDHVGIVEKYESGKVHTIEGNSSNKLRRKSYNIDSCKIIGFGSWY